MTSALWGGVLEMMTHDDRGEGGVKNCQNGGDVICGWPLSFPAPNVFLMFGKTLILSFSFT